MRRSVLDMIASADPFTGLLATRQRVLCRRREPVGQDREGPMARSADAPAHPYAVVQFIMSLPESTSVTDNRVVAAHWASPREAFQRNYPGSTLSFDSGSAIKRITAGVKARR